MIIIITIQTLIILESKTHFLSNSRNGEIKRRHEVLQIDSLVAEHKWSLPYATKFTKNYCGQYKNLHSLG